MAMNWSVMFIFVLTILLQESIVVVGDVSKNDVLHIIYLYQARYCPGMTCNDGSKSRQKRSFLVDPRSVAPKSCYLCEACYCDRMCWEFNDCCPDLQLHSSSSPDLFSINNTKEDDCELKQDISFKENLNGSSSRSSRSSNSSSSSSSSSSKQMEDTKAYLNKNTRRRKSNLRQNVVKRSANMVVLHSTGDRTKIPDTWNNIKAPHSSHTHENVAMFLNEENNDTSTVELNNAGKHDALMTDVDDSEEDTGDEIENEIKMKDCDSFNAANTVTLDMIEPNDASVLQQTSNYIDNGVKPSKKRKRASDAEQSNGFQCSAVGKGCYWTRTTCNEDDVGYTAARADRCRQKWQDDPLTLPPVTSVTSSGRNVTYNNQYCALCHGIVNFTFWQMRVECPDSIQLPALTNTSQLLEYALNITDCDVYYYPSPSITPKTCTSPQDIITRCTVTKFDQRNALIRQACNAYTHPFHEEGVVYRNVFCYLCNGGTEEGLGRTCVKEGHESWMSTMSSLLTFMPKSGEVQIPVGKGPEACQPDAVYDPSAASCKPISCPVYREAVRDSGGNVTCQWIFRQMAGIDIQVNAALRLHVPYDDVILSRNQINATAAKVIASLKQRLLKRGNIVVSFIRIYTYTETTVGNTLSQENVQAVNKQQGHNRQFRVKMFRITMLVKNRVPEDPDITFKILSDMFNSNMSLTLLGGLSLSVTATLLETNISSNCEAFASIFSTEKPLTVSSQMNPNDEASVCKDGSCTSEDGLNNSTEIREAKMVTNNTSAKTIHGDGTSKMQALVQNTESALAQNVSELNAKDERDLLNETVVFSVEWPPSGMGIRPGMLHSPVPLLTHLNCPTVKINARRFSVVEDGRVLIHAFETYLHEESFQLLEDGDLLVCVDNFIDMADRYKQKAEEGKKYPFLIITSLVQSVGLLCLVLTILALVLFSELRTVPGYNLLFLSLALLLVQLPLALPHHLFRQTVVCRVVATWQHYFWLQVFAWMTVASCHMFYCFRHMLRAVRLPNRGSGPMKRYCLIAMGIPLLLVSGHVLASYWLSDNHSTGYARARGVCFLASSTVSVVTFATPLVLTILTTTLLLALTVCSLRRASIGIQARPRNNNLVNYCKLSTLTGVTWGLGVAGEWLDSEMMTTMFNVLCGGHGFFLFLAFIANRRTARLFLAFVRRRRAESGSSTQLTLRFKNTVSLQPPLPPPPPSPSSSPPPLPPAATTPPCQSTDMPCVGSESSTVCSE